tara:strand:- start:88 stop:726 length:639 start_codon:yes stop_codon:yes gene_type:complete
MAEQYQRQTAYKAWIQHIHAARLQKDSETGFTSYVHQDRSLVRVNVVGSVIHSYKSENYGSILLDDGSGSIRLKVWGDDMYLFEDFSVGDLLLVVGRVGDFQGERYIRPEVVRKVSIDWALFRRLELVKYFGVPSAEEKVSVAIDDSPQPEVEPSLLAREVIITTIEKMDEATEQDLVSACDLPKEKVLVALQDLLKEGEIFSPKKGMYRLV